MNKKYYANSLNDQFQPMKKNVYTHRNILYNYSIANIDYTKRLLKWYKRQKQLTFWLLDVEKLLSPEWQISTALQVYWLLCEKGGASKSPAHILPCIFKTEV